MRLAFALWLAAACAAQVHKAAPDLDRIVPPGAQIEKLGGDFGFTEGPLWMRGGFLIFSDIPKNVIRRWNPDGALSVFRENSNGANGLTLDLQGRIVACEQIGRRLVRYEQNGNLTVLAERYEGQHLNSPNDVVCRSDGSLYFTDPPYGLPEQDGDPGKELAFNGVYRLSGSKLQLLHKDLTRPNGIAFSPDEKILYEANSDGKRKLWMRFDVRGNGSLSNGAVFYDAAGENAPGGPDGMKVDTAGNLYCTGPGGIWIFSPSARHLGTIQFPEVPANCAWGGEDGKTLYVTARTGLYRIRLNIAG